ncbi:MAG: CvpA family protein [Spirochaetaceae bacterium]|jgi:membrane protein required for colicin V production|nr:CvpA family protein [Spirochaetaceae bacterium]
MELSILDCILIFVFLTVAVHAAFRGFVAELAGVAWLVAGLLFAASFYAQGAAYLRTWVLGELDYVPEVLAFLALFLAAFVVVKILGCMLKEIVEGMHLSALDKVLGVVFGLVKGVVVVGFILFAMRVQPVFDARELLRDSAVYGFLTPQLDRFGGRGFGLPDGGREGLPEGSFDV